MGYKYKLKEQDLPQVSKGGNFKVGDVKISGGTKYTVRNIDPETGAIAWKVESVPAIGSTFKEFQDLRKFITTLSRETKDEVIDDIANDIRDAFNRYRTHIRKNYPESYKKFTMNEEEVEEISTSAGAGSYLTKYAFKKPKKQEKLPEGVGATLGPGPKASEDGVKDNYMVKAFKYKLVPKDKKGNYVQKGSGLEVKNF
jgi:hypothetical protein